jgi:hypothetical protein
VRSVHRECGSGIPVDEKEKVTNIGSFIKSEEGSVKMSGKNVNLQNTKYCWAKWHNAAC